MPKIIKLIQDAVDQERFFYGFEVFPPKTTDGVVNLYERMGRMAHLNPLYCSITWGDAMSTATLSHEIASSTQNLMGMEAMLHITSTKTPKSALIEALHKAKSAGIVNLCVVRGSKGTEQDSELFHAIDLIRLIRQEFKDHFGIAVAASPEGEECGEGPTESNTTYLNYLRQKVEAGADFIITQLFYDENVFLRFTVQCKEAGINCPIIPGIMPINTYQQFLRYSTCTKERISQIREEIDLIRRDDAKVREYGLEVVCRVMKNLMRSGVRGFHIYTLNVEKQVRTILQKLRIVDIRRELPWRKSAIEGRCTKEEVRPIFWSGRAASYLARTREWEEFPNGRWGDSRSAAYGEDDSYHTQLVLTSSVNADLFHTCQTVADVCMDVLSSLIEGRPLPWTDSIATETEIILNDVLLPLNSHGFLTINSQPRQDGTSSTHEVFGWGPPNGFVYQKQYVEFFCSPQNLAIVLETVRNFQWITYMYAGPGDSVLITNNDSVNAVTWGVFCGREIIQPTIVDVESFRAWRDEAYRLWFAPFADGTSVPPVIHEIASQWYLVNLVDNDYRERDSGVPTYFDALVTCLLSKAECLVPSKNVQKLKMKA